MENEELYTPKQMILGAGINRDLYNQWLYKGIIDASREAEGSGTKSGYSLDDICRVLIICYLRKNAIRLKHASAAASAIIKLKAGKKRKSKFMAGAIFEIFVDESGKYIVRFFQEKGSPVGTYVDFDAIQSEVLTNLG